MTFTTVKAFWMMFWPLLAWFGLGKLMGLDNFDAALLAGVGWCLSGYYFLSLKVSAMEKRLAQRSD